MSSTVIRRIHRADAATIAALADMGVATVHEAQARSGLARPSLRPIYAGARIARHVPAHVQLVLFALFGLTGSAMMFRAAMKMSGKPDFTGYEFRGDTRTVALLAAEGAGVGLMTGLIGVGGGFLIVPALVFVAKLPMRLAIGTSLLVITLNALSGFAGYLGTVPIDWHLVSWFTSIAAIGSIAGALISKRVPQKRLKQVFGILLIGVSLYVLYRR